MCQHWLCATGTDQRCYFEAGDLGNRVGVDLTDKLWDEMDALHERLRQSHGNRGTASELGKSINWALRDAISASNHVGQQRREQLEARYAHKPDQHAPLPPLRVVVRAEHDAATAAAEIRKLGEAFAAALGDELRK